MPVFTGMSSQEPPETSEFAFDSRNDDSCIIRLPRGIDGSLHGIVDENTAVAGLVVEVFHNFFHAYDGVCREAVNFLNFLQSALVALAAFAAVEGNDQTLDFNVGLCLDEGSQLLGTRLCATTPRRKSWSQIVDDGGQCDA